MLGIFQRRITLRREATSVVIARREAAPVVILRREAVPRVILRREAPKGSPSIQGFYSRGARAILRSLRSHQDDTRGSLRSHQDDTRGSLRSHQDDARGPIGMLRLPRALSTLLVLTLLTVA